MKRRPTYSKPTGSKSPISDRKQQLANQEALVKKQMADLEREILEAPARRQAQLNAQRNELLRTYEQKRGTDFFSSIQDKRHVLNGHTGVMPVSRRKRKGEQRAAQLQFFTLVVLLIFAVLFLLRSIPW